MYAAGKPMGQRAAVETLEPILPRSGCLWDLAGASGGLLPHHGHVGETTREYLSQ